MRQALYDNFLLIIRQELIIALGCTEPIAIAYIAACARDTLDSPPVSCVVRCSGNVIKNVKGVSVPYAKGLRGMDVAAILGIVGGDAKRKLEVLETVTPAHLEQAQKLLNSGFCRCELAQGVENLYIQVILTDEQGGTVEVEARQYHSNITRIVKNGEIVFEKQQTCETVHAEGDKSLLNVQDILAFADRVRMEDVEDLLSSQVKCNTAISQAGLTGEYGVQAGRTLMQLGGTRDLRIRARAAAAAGSDARMNGCPLPVVINSGSGNQGITVTMPVVEYAKAYSKSNEELYRALLVANLISVHQKKYIGSLSAYCGAVCAACGAAAGIAYLLGESFEVICDTITNTIATIGGMVCDGAKSSCATKIASAVDCALCSLDIARRGHVFQPGEGMVKQDVERTIESVGRMGRIGMQETDTEILSIMLED